MLHEITCKECTIKKALEYMGQEKNKMYRWILKDIFSDSNNYNGNKKERLLARCEDVQHGCSTGIVSSLIYYRDTTAFFKKFKKEIIEMVNELIQEGVIERLDQLNGWDNEDPFCEDIYNRNLLAWLAYEEVNNQLYYYLES